MKSLVITTINHPTEALKKYADILLERGWTVIVVGDKKTPGDFGLPGIEYLSVEKQFEYFGDLASLIPFNHYSRKTLGYLYAIVNGAEIIAESDDDNIPYPDKYPNFLSAQVKTPFVSHRGVVNVYSYFTSKKVWPRGIPLDSIKNLVDETKVQPAEVNCYIQQGLADLDPDVDAIYRLTAGEEVTFDTDKTLALSAGCYSPFNTQNTLFYKEAFPLLFLPISVKSRVTDIWRSYIAQRLLWEKNSHVLFLSPSVYQLRNEHNLLHDFQEEIPLYTEVNALIQLLDSFSSNSDHFCDLMLEMYSYLDKNQFFSELELCTCEAWIKAIEGFV